MKKILTIVLALSALLGLTSCVSNDSKPTLAAKNGTISAQITQKYAKELELDVEYYKDSPLMYQAVMNGTNAACYEDRNVIIWAIRNDGLALKTVGEIENPSEYSLAVKKGTNSDLLAMFNAGLANIKASGEYDAILAKYGFDDTNFKDDSIKRVESGITPEKKYIIYSDSAFAPFEFLDAETKKYIGIDLDLIAAIAKDQGFEYEVHNEGFEEAVSAVKSGKADAVIAGMSADEKRKQDFDFSDGYFEDGQILVVPIGSDIESIYDLKQK